MEDFIKGAKAIADETRLRILNLLMERECCVCEVVQALGISQTRASRNLGILREAGFLKVRKDGLWAFYSIKLESPFQVGLVGTINSALKDETTLKNDLERLKKAQRLNRCP